MIELLCVLAIIGILAGLLLGPVGRALRKARGFKAEMETPTHVVRLTDGMRKFAASHATWSCPDVETFLAFAKPGPRRSAGSRRSGSNSSPSATTLRPRRR